jgi:hypothetical protein
VTTKETEPAFERSSVAVCAYRDLDAFYAEAKKYAEIGFFPTTVTNQPQQAGLIRGLLLNLMALVWTPAPIVIVTYEKRD